MPNDAAINLNSAAVSLGWRLTEIYRQASYDDPDGVSTVLGHLPDVEQMTGGERATALTYLIEKGAQQLGLASDASPGTEIRDALAHLRGDIQAKRSGEDIKSDIADIYVKIRDKLSGIDPEQATALSLGQFLADTCLTPSAGSANSYHTVFKPSRLQNAYDWLDELSQVLPPRSAKAVSQSLAAWAAWIARPEFSFRIRHRGERSAYDAAANISLRRQGALWRRLLSGEQDPRDLLDSGAYVTAGVRMLDRIGRMSWGFVRRWWFPTLAILVVLTATIVGLLRYAPAGTSRSVALTITVLGALGVTWKGIGGTLGKALGALQAPLWEAEVSEALSIAATRLPPVAKSVDELPSHITETETRSAA